MADADSTAGLDRPRLSRQASGDIAWWTDVAIARAGVVVAFTERTGGVSPAPYQSLNLATHVGDSPSCVQENRYRLMEALGLSNHVTALVTAEQVHGSRIRLVGARTGHSGASPRAPLTETDAMITATPGIPLLMCFADCVPIILVAPGPAIAVAHAGWRGALAGLPAGSVRALCVEAGCEASSVLAYVGTHIAPCHYEVSDELLSQFEDSFGTVARAGSRGLDLGAVVAVNLIDAGVQSCRIASLGGCTAEETDRFFSHRAEAGLTGRHGALACIIG